MVAMILVGAVVSCSKPSSFERAPTSAASAEAPSEGVKTASDLDRPVSELVTLTCEHHKKTYECNECRYEVGFVRIPATIAQGGLFTTTRPTREKASVPIALTGEVRFDERRVAHLSAQVEGIIKRVHVVLGDRVKKGQPLLELESVAVGEEQATYLETQGLLGLARRNFERLSALRQENIASEKEYLQAKQEVDSSEIRAAAARAKLNRLGSSATTGGRIVLSAPMDGTVLRLHAVSGEVARTDESLLTVGDNTAVWVWADLYERDIAAVTKGQAAGKLQATVSVKAYPGEEFQGTVELVSPAMDESSRTVKVRIQVNNDDRRLLVGMFASVKLFLPGTDETTVLPKQAVLEDEGRAYVFVHYQGDDYVRRPVVVGRSWANVVEIKKGIEPSQTVVVDGSFLLKSDVLRSKMGAGCAD
jgi:cobalt-zinc-cadmium efflux system membrane fusion protein